LGLSAVVYSDSLDTSILWLSVAICPESVELTVFELFSLSLSSFSSFTSETGFSFSYAGQSLGEGSMTTLVSSTSLPSSKQTF